MAKDKIATIAGNSGTVPTLWRRPVVENKTGLKKAQLYALIRAGAFPAPVKLSERCSAWLETEVIAWIHARIDERNRANGAQ